MRQKTLNNRVTKWLHEFPLVYGLDSFLPGDRHGRKRNLRLVFWHDKDVTQETKDEIFRRVQAEYECEVHWVVSVPFSLE